MDEIAIIPEVITVPGDRDATGKFIPGNRITRRGSVNRITRAMRLEGLEDMVARGLNPIMEATRRVQDPDLHPRYQMDALRLLFSTFFGEKTVVELELPDPIDEAEVQRTKRMLIGLFTEETSNAKPLS